MFPLATTMRSSIYLDHAATSPLHPGVLEAMLACFRGGVGNASAIHQSGVRAARLVEQGRLVLSRRLGGQPEELIFTSGGTEANNLALKGAALAGNRRCGHVVTTAFEHSSVRESVRWLQGRGFEVTFLPVDGRGVVAPEVLRASLRADTVLVSVIHGHNELGTVQPIEALGTVCRQADVLLHVDACQSYARMPLDVASLPVDMVSINAHKLGGPQGIGALWVRTGVPLEVLLHGGGQERGLRSGTSNTAGVVGFATAVELTTPEGTQRLARQRAEFVEGLRDRLPGAWVNGPGQGALPHIISVTLPEVEGKWLFQQLNRRGFRVSLGSACRAGSTDPSQALLAVGLTEGLARSTIRVSPGYDTRDEDLDQLIDALAELVSTGVAP